MTNKKLQKEFMQKVWNEKDFEGIKKYVAPGYTIHIDTADPREGKTLNHAAFAERLNYSFDSFPDINFEIQTVIRMGIMWPLPG